MPASTDSYMIFENCFVPWERVFLAGEHQLGGINALLFALFHRHSYSGCKPAIGDIVLGAAALAAEANNIQKESHVREKLAELIMVIELGYAAGYTASDLGRTEGSLMPGKGSSVRPGVLLFRIRSTATSGAASPGENGVPRGGDPVRHLRRRQRHLPPRRIS